NSRTRRLAHSDRHSAVNDDGLAGHAVRAAESHDLLRDVIGAARFAENRLRTSAFLYLLGDTIGHARALDQSRRDAIDAHIGTQCNGETMCQVNQRGLAARVANTAAPGSYSRERCDIDDAAALVPAQL